MAYQARFSGDGMMGYSVPPGWVVGWALCWFMAEGNLQKGAQPNKPADIRLPYVDPRGKELLQTKGLWSASESVCFSNCELSLSFTLKGAKKDPFEECRLTSVPGSCRK